MKIVPYRYTTLYCEPSYPFSFVCQLNEVATGDLRYSWEKISHWSRILTA